MKKTLIMVLFNTGLLLFGQHNHSLSLIGGIDPHTHLGLEYSYNLANLGILNKPNISLGLATSLTEPSFDHINLDGQFGATVWQYKNWRLNSAVGLQLIHSENVNFTATGFSMDGIIRPGYYGDIFQGGLHLSYKEYLLTHISHSNHYREVYYPQAVDGWYWADGGSFHFGLFLGLKISQQYLIELNGTTSFDQDFTPRGGSPLNAQLAFGYRF